MHGIKGEVKVTLTTDSPKQRFGKAGTKLYLRAPVQKGGLLAKKEDPVPLIEVKIVGGKGLTHAHTHSLSL